MMGGGVSERRRARERKVEAGWIGPKCDISCSSLVG